jgi:hypothetical protein
VADPARVLKKRDVADALGYGERYAPRLVVAADARPRGAGAVAARFRHGRLHRRQLLERPRARHVAVLLTHRRSPSFDLAPWRRRFHRMAVDLVAEMPRALAS